MTTLSEYFTEHRYHPTYFLGDRVRGIWNGIPFTGSVAIDTQVYDAEIPYVMVFSDLPLTVDNVVYTIIRCTHEQLHTL